MTRGRGLYLEDQELGRLKSVARRVVETADFWNYVDSQPSYTTRTHEGCCTKILDVWGHTRTDCRVWEHVRGDGCLASASDLSRCGQAPVDGVPFCDFHLDHAWLALLAVITRERHEVEVRMHKFNHDRILRDAGIELAEVRDARKVLAAQPERVYFFAAGRAVKVGRSINPERRVKSFGTTLAPADVDVRAGSLLGTIPGGSRVEGTLHMRFSRHHIVGEWFELEPIRDQIDALLEEQLADTG